MTRKQLPSLEIKTHLQEIGLSDHRIQRDSTKLEQLPVTTVCQKLRCNRDVFLSPCIQEGITARDNIQSREKRRHCIFSSTHLQPFSYHTDCQIQYKRLWELQFSEIQYKRRNRKRDSESWGEGNQFCVQIFSDLLPEENGLSYIFHSFYQKATTLWLSSQVFIEQDHFLLHKMTKDPKERVNDMQTPRFLSPSLLPAVTQSTKLYSCLKYPYCIGYIVSLVLHFKFLPFKTKLFTFFASICQGVLYLGNCRDI